MQELGDNGLNVPFKNICSHATESNIEYSYIIVSFGFPTYYITLSRSRPPYPPVTLFHWDWLAPAPKMSFFNSIGCV